MSGQVEGEVTKVKVTLAAATGGISAVLFSLWFVANYAIDFSNLPMY